MATPHRLPPTLLLHRIPKISLLYLPKILSSFCRRISQTWLAMWKSLIAFPSLFRRESGIVKVITYLLQSLVLSIQSPYLGIFSPAELRDSDQPKDCPTRNVFSSVKSVQNNIPRATSAQLYHVPFTWSTARELPGSGQCATWAPVSSSPDPSNSNLIPFFSACPDNLFTKCPLDDRFLEDLYTIFL